MTELALALSIVGFLVWSVAIPLGKPRLRTFGGVLLILALILLCWLVAVGPVEVRYPWHPYP